ncbi:hypothetical protein BBJ29_004191 [Phytophthora kernoviae]|uniref:RING-type domain-containing protein n=1 Tax=Phytophthora kernoviae TaxID=325452 RepID=A0A421FSG9_9STRA|nr:hypothetical protein BBJ29_004191 [Phytophthora kernoviae]
MTCHLCRSVLYIPQLKAPCGHNLCRNCVNIRVLAQLRQDSYSFSVGVPVSCCDKQLPLDVVQRVITGRNLTKYAKMMVKHDIAMKSATTSNKRDTKRKTPSTATPTSTARKVPKRQVSPASFTLRSASKGKGGHQEKECSACFVKVTQPEQWFLGPCGHGYCRSCMTKMANACLEQRDKVPVRCCSTDFPIDYVEQVLSKLKLEKYNRFLHEQDPNMSTLQSDHIKWLAPIEESMEVLSALKELDGQYEHVIWPKLDVIDLANNSDDEELADVYALEVYHEEIRRAEQLVLDQAIARSLYAKEELKLLHPTDADSDSDDDYLVVIDMIDLVGVEDCKLPPNCTCCLGPLKDISARLPMPCGHLYCTKCVATRCRMGVRDRSMVPAHCCRKEFPTDYVREALNPWEFATYDRFLKEKPWKTLDLESDREYTRTVREHRGVQCPGCGVGVQKSSGCNRMYCLNGHEFCFLCGAQWRTCACSYN